MHIPFQIWSVCKINDFFFKYFHNHGTWPSRSLLSNLFFLKNIILEYLVSCVAIKSSLTSFKGEAPQYPPAFLVHLLLFLFLFPSLYYLPRAPGVVGRSRFLTTIHSSRTHVAVQEGDSKRIYIQALPLTCHRLWASYSLGSWAPF